MAQRPLSAAASPRRLSALLRTTHGATAVEYVIVVGTVAIPLIPAFIAVVQGIVRDLDQMQAMLLMPFP